ncbi:MAG: hypothetical protein D6744_00125 [Planctomycetota bacterium]|nr:MAG: hypothetical protein D6744_00125 [Planctomycetota bacterium]
MSSISLKTLVRAARRPAACVLATAAMLSGACRAHPLAEQRAAMRSERISHTLNTFVANERESGERLAQAPAAIEKNIDRHGRQLRENIASFGRQIAADSIRWRRNEAAYTEHFAREMRGRPERIVETIITLLY